jgi:hypothetical protein
MRTFSPSRPAAFLLAAVWALFVAAVGAVGAAAPATAAPPPSHVAAADPPAWVRAAHLIPGLGTMTISLVPFAGAGSGSVEPSAVPPATSANGARILAPTAGYGTVGDYRQVPSGTYAVAVRPAGAAADSVPLLTGSLVAEGGHAVTLAAVGRKESPRFETLEDDLTAPTGDRARVRVVPAVPGATGLEVSAENGPMLVEGAAFADATGYRAVPSGGWTLTATATGSGGGDLGPATGEVDLAAGGVYSVFVLAEGQDGLALQAVVDARGMETAPRGGVQTGAGGAAVPRVGPVVPAGLGTAAAGLAVLLVLGLRARRRSAGVLGR